MILQTKELAGIAAMAEVRTILTLPKKEYNFTHIMEKYVGQKGQPHRMGCTTDIAMLLIHKQNKQYQDYESMYSELESAMHTYAKN